MWKLFVAHSISEIEKILPRDTIKILEVGNEQYVKFLMLWNVALVQKILRTYLTVRPTLLYSIIRLC